MAPFRSHLLDHWRRHLFGPLQSLTGLDGPELLSLASGPATLALLPGPPDAHGRPGAVVPLLLIHAGPHLPRLESRLATLPAIHGTRRTLIQDVPFQSVPLDPARAQHFLDTAFPMPAGATPPRRVRFPDVLHVGIAHASLLVSTSIPALESALAYLSGTAPGPHLASAPPWTGPHPQPDDTLVHGALNVPALLARMEALPATRRLFPGGPPLARTIEALGLRAVRSATLLLQASPSSGWRLDLHLAAPAAERRGLLSLLEPGPGPATPPDFIPAQVESFRRLRLAGPAAWTRFERLLRDLHPPLLGVLQLITGTAGLADDPAFNFQRNLIDALGDDWIAATFPRPAIHDPPGRIHLFGTPRPAELTRALAVVANPDFLAAFLPPGAPAPVRQQRNVNGRPWVSLDLPALPWPWPPGSTGTLHFAATSEYLAASANAATLPPLLELPAAAQPLGADPRFQTALALAGGPEGGYLAYQDQPAIARRFGSQPDRVAAWLARVARWAAVTDVTARISAAWTAGMDPHRLPDLSAIAPHLGIAVQRGWADADGLHLSCVHPPAPPAPSTRRP